MISFVIAGIVTFAIGVLADDARLRGVGVVLGLVGLMLVAIEVSLVPEIRP